MLCRTTFSSNIYTYTSVLYPHRPTCMHELRNKNLIKIQIYFPSIPFSSLKNISGNSKRNKWLKHAKPCISVNVYLLPYRYSLV